MPDTATPQPPRIEALVVRDPDGGATIDVWIDGIRVRDRDLWVTTVDAGRGHDCDSWIEERDLSVAHASPAAGRAIQAAYDDPPGAEYIDDFPPKQILVMTGQRNLATEPPVGAVVRRSFPDGSGATFEHVDTRGWVSRWNLNATASPNRWRWCEVAAPAAAATRRSATSKAGTFTRSVSARSTRSPLRTTATGTARAGRC